MVHWAGMRKKNDVDVQWCFPLHVMGWGNMGSVERLDFSIFDQSSCTMPEMLKISKWQFLCLYALKGESTDLHDSPSMGWKSCLKVKKKLALD